MARAVEDLLDLQMDLINPGRELIKIASELAFRHGTTLYDSCYLALGQLMGIEVYTSDKHLFDGPEENRLLRFL